MSITDIAKKTAAEWLLLVESRRMQEQQKQVFWVAVIDTEKDEILEGFPKAILALNEQRARDEVVADLAENYSDKLEIQVRLF